MNCALCADEWPDADGGLESYVDHLRIHHPNQYEPFERWPDGGLVVTDATLEPGDFS